jgi:hypothetical protein
MFLTVAFVFEVSTLSFLSTVRFASHLPCSGTVSVTFPTRAVPYAYTTRYWELCIFSSTLVVSLEGKLVLRALCVLSFHLSPWSYCGVPQFHVFFSKRGVLKHFFCVSNEKLQLIHLLSSGFHRVFRNLKKNRRQKGNTKQFPNGGPINIRSRRSKFSRSGDPAPGVCTRVFYMCL